MNRGRIQIQAQQTYPTLNFRCDCNVMDVVLTVARIRKPKRSEWAVSPKIPEIGDLLATLPRV